ncbi:MAG TPA: phage holin family protein [Casimicrobiaceae bacterium]|nr:phage holin family protein [Casimicrobiaceae bacterium]
MRGAVGALGGAILGLLHTRLELAAVELDELRGRSIERLVFVLVAVLALSFAVLGASALVVVAFWDTNRIAALSIVILVYVAIGLFALWRLAARSRTDRPPFAETIAQFERDRVWLAGKAGEE